MTTVTAINLQGDHERVTLPQPHYWKQARGQEDYGGVWITGIYSGPRSGRRFVETESIWDDGRHIGICVGTTFKEVSESEYLTACERVRCEPENVKATEV